MIKPQCILEKTITGIAFNETVQDEWPHKWDKQDILYAVIASSDDLRAKDQVIALNFAMTQWDVEIKNDFTLARGDEEPDITIAFVSSKDDDFLKARPSVLAYAYYPKTSKEGIVVFNDDYIWSLDGVPRDNPMTPAPTDTLKTWNLIQTLTHELGHTLGLTHSVRGLGLDIMDPYYNPKILQPSSYDIKRLLDEKYESEGWIARKLSRIRAWFRIRARRF